MIKQAAFVGGLMLLLLEGMYSVTHADVTQNVVTGSRAFDTTYQNTTGYPLFVSSSFYTSSATDSGRIACITDASSPPTTIVNYSTSMPPVGPTGYTDIENCLFLVPNLYYYRVNGTNAPTLYVWTEWAMASSTGGSITNSTTTIQLIGLAPTSSIAVNVATSTFTSTPDYTIHWLIVGALFLAWFLGFVWLFRTRV